MKKITRSLLLCTSLIHSSAFADAQFDLGFKNLQSRVGCFLVDYSYSETESLKPGYTLDPRVYDVNRDKTVKEWIYSEVISDQRVRLQHILFSTDASGNIPEHGFLKHQAEDWEYNAAFLYDFVKPSHWEIKDLSATPGLWTRRITNLDDGLRYQCAAQWSANTEYSEWSCDNYSPIPGRETRDMGRKDYNTLSRSTRLIAYGNSFLERQMNIKTIDQDGVRTPLARELGKDWYVRIPDSECAAARLFVEPRKGFWTLLRETWDQVLDGKSTFVENSVGKPPRYAKIFELEAKALSSDLNDPATRAQMKQTILNTIQEYRK